MRKANTPFPEMIQDSEVKRVVERSLNSQTTTLTAPVASGKSTLIPAAIARELKLVNEDRTIRVAVCVPTLPLARQLARRVAATNDDLKVSTRSSRTTQEDAELTYITPGSLLVDYLSSLSRRRERSQLPWDFIVFDEVHTGDFETSIILSLHVFLFDKSSGYYPKFDIPKILLMTATPVPLPLFEKLSVTKLLVKDLVYAGKGLYSPGAVQQTKYLDSKPKNIVTEMASRIKSICTEKNSYGIIAFVDGIVMMNKLFHSLTDLKGVQLVRLYGESTPEDWSLVEKPTSSRKIIIATNIAESGVTIRGIGYIVDSLLEKRPYPGVFGASVYLKRTYISYNSSVQRAGRAGRDVAKKMYYPMLTESLFQDLVKEQGFKPKDIEVVPLEKSCIELIYNGFNPRKILEEAKQEKITDTLKRLLENGILKLVSYRASRGFEPSDGQKKVYKKILRGEVVAYTDALEFILVGAVQEVFEITNFGNFCSLLPIGIVGCIFLREWLKISESTLMGCLVASLMNSGVEKLFVTPIEDEEREKHLKENYEKYIGSSSLVTALNVFYSLFVEYPDILELKFDQDGIKAWCRRNKFSIRVVLEVLRTWKRTIVALDNTVHCNLELLLDIPNVVEAVNKSLSNDFFELKKSRTAAYNRAGNAANAYISKHGIPYTGFPGQTLKFLSFQQVQNSEIILLFLNPGVQATTQFLLPRKRVSIQLRTNRYPIVVPEDVGLSSKRLVVPAALNFDNFPEVQARPPRSYSFTLVPELFQDKTVRIPEKKLVEVDYYSTIDLGDLLLDFGDDFESTTDFEDIDLNRFSNAFEVYSPEGAEYLDEDVYEGLHGYDPAVPFY